VKGLAVSVSSSVAQLWAKADHPGVRAFFISIFALSVALLFALYSGAAAELGHVGLSIASALAALVVAAWVGVTLVPVLARRTPLRWISYKMEYKITREGWVYIGGIIIVALAALNTGNNLLFLILASLIAIILMSGILSSITLTGVAMRLELPEHIFAGWRLPCTFPTCRNASGYAKTSQSRSRDAVPTAKTPSASSPASRSAFCKKRGAWSCTPRSSSIRRSSRLATSSRFCPHCRERWKA
jgi:hypothetical protein